MGLFIYLFAVLMCCLYVALQLGTDARILVALVLEQPISNISVLAYLRYLCIFYHNNVPYSSGSQPFLYQDPIISIDGQSSAPHS